MKAKFLRHYTDFPSLIYLLKHNVLTLRSPELWDDKNDSYYISKFKSELGLSTVLALCFVKSLEKYHYWRVFAQGPSGVCITFNREKLVEHIKHEEGVSCDSVKYLQFKDREKGDINTDRLPFTKRWGFKDEREFRIIFKSKNEELLTKDVKIPLSTISKITLSPWMPSAFKETITTIIHSIKGCEKIKIVKSHLLDSPTWKKLSENK